MRLLVVSVCFVFLLDIQRFKRKKGPNIYKRSAWTFSCAMLSWVSWTTLHRVLPVPCCPNSIKTRLNKIFSYVMLSGASRATLHNTGHYFSFFMFFLRNVLCRLLDNNASGVNLCNVFPRVLRQHWTRFFPVRCCLKPQGQYCIGFLSVNIVPRVSSHGTALHRKKLM